MNFEVIQQVAKSLVEASYSYDNLIKEKIQLKNEVVGLHFGKKKVKLEEIKQIDLEIKTLKRNILTFTTNIQELVKKEETALKNE